MEAFIRLSGRFKLGSGTYGKVKVRILTAVLLLVLVVLPPSVVVISEDTEVKGQDEEAEEGENNSFKGAPCTDEIPEELCDEAIRVQCSRDHEYTSKCRRSCRLCVPGPNDRDWSSPEERASKCKDQLMGCDVLSNPCICCLYRPIMNVTCQRSCRFCYDMNSIPGMSSMPIPLGSAPGGIEPPVVYQDPCNPTKPPSMGGGPGIPGGGGGGIPSGSQGSGGGGGGSPLSNIPGTSPGNQPGIPGGGSSSPGGFGSTSGLPIACGGTAGLPTG